MAKLGDVFPLVRNGASIRQTDGATGIPITRIETISNREIDRNKFGYANIIDGSKYKDYILQDGDILMSHINSEKHLGKVALYRKQGNEQIIHGMNLLMLRANPSVLFPPYATYFFETPAFLMQIQKITKKSVNQASFTVTALKEIEIPLPPLGEQCRIAAVLDKVSGLIAKRREQLDKLDELVKARFVEMFGDFKLNTKNWPVASFDEIAIIDGNMTTDYEKYANYPHIGIDSIEKETGALTGYRTVAEDGVISGKYLFTPKHIIYSKIRPNLNKVALPKFYGLCSADAYPILPIEGKCNRIFLAYDMRSQFFLDYILQFCNRTNLPKVNRKEVSGFKTPLPPIELQNKFATIVEQTGKSKLTIQQSLDKLEMLKKSLMQQYFGG
ncbi:restriction endonuclease subunit S [uncultured Oscillibacter sp.]|uniref:restriction endonuclease subunit S n=1 Tax=uncultured Oscillibacter sp. TaxID=876091 RepID=UPI0028044C46|nr:restriction endonuclease subunit S [uncultured Oscillibacter sp.]